MQNTSSGRLGLLLRRIGIRVARACQLREEPMAVNIDDPLGGALRDTDLLLAFAAQSYRKIEEDKVRQLTSAAQVISAARAAGATVSADQKADFWLAYDALTADMAPLSAHSIRASIQVNALRFPRSLLTPTAYNAAFAVMVFILCLALQGFWVAGKELIDRADAIEVQRTEVQAKLLRAVAQAERSEARSRALASQRCLLHPGCHELEALPGYLRPATLDPTRVEALNAELSLATSDLKEKQTLSKEAQDELNKINEKSRPLESLLRKWHSRASAVCAKEVLRFLCPVDNPAVPDSKRTEELRAQLSLARAREEANVRKRLELEVAVVVNKDTLMRDMEKYNRNLLERNIDERKAQSLESELAVMESDAFRSIVVEARIIVANVGTYLIAMVMGILGALTFILRSLSAQLREHTYVPVSASISIVRVCLGAIAGVFGSLLAPGDPTLKSLPPLFIPFAFGYGIEILFSLLDKVVKAFTQGDTSGQRP